jgi:alcohol dehydrogenase class IV
VAAAYGSRAILVTGHRSFDALPERDEILASFAAAGVQLLDRVTVVGEPDDQGVIDAAQRIGVVGAEVLLAVGGGSVMDLAKAAAVIASGVSLESVLAGMTVEAGGVPVIALPTTAGSGAEVSRGAIVLHRSAGRKRGIRGPGVAARVALVDPQLTVTADERVTAESGFDAMAHAVETSVSLAASPVNVLLAGEAMRRLLAAVPAAIHDPRDLDARESAAYAAMLMGINLATASTCLPHRMQYPVGAATGTSHPRGVAALFPSWLRRTELVAPERLSALALSARLVPEAASPGEGATAVIDCVERWMAAIGVRTTLSELGVRPDDVPELAAMVEGNLQNDPGPSGPSNLVSLYEASL